MLKHYEAEALELMQHVQYPRMNMLAAALGGTPQRRRRELSDLFGRGYVHRHHPAGDGEQRSTYPNRWPRIFSLPHRDAKIPWHNVKVGDVVLSMKAGAREANVPFQFKDELLAG